MDDAPCSSIQGCLDSRVAGHRPRGGVQFDDAQAGVARTEGLRRQLHGNSRGRESPDRLAIPEDVQCAVWVGPQTHRGTFTPRQRDQEIDRERRPLPRLHTLPVLALAAQSVAEGQGRGCQRERLLLSGWAANDPELGEAYRHEEAFYGVYDGTGTRDQALARYAVWRRSATPEVRDAFSDLIRAFAQLAAADSRLLRSSQMTKPKFRRREAEPTVGYAMFEMVAGASFGRAHRGRQALSRSTHTNPGFL